VEPARQRDIVDLLELIGADGLAAQAKALANGEE
jgi:hypothetical protein